MAEYPHFPPALVRQLAGVDRRGVRLIPLATMSVLSLRARDEGLDRAAAALGLVSLPTPNSVASTAVGDCLWVRPDEWLVVGDTADRERTLAALESAIGPDDGAVVDISASRVLLELSGPRSRDVLASCCPLDLHPTVFDTGRCAQSVVGKAPVLLQLMDDAPRWRIMMRPSLSGYVTSWLTDGMLGE